MKKSSQNKTEALAQSKEWISKELDCLAREMAWK